MTNETKQMVEKVFKGGKRLRVVGYRNSAGEVQDLEVEMIGLEGYWRLVRESMEWLKKLERPAVLTDEAAFNAGRAEQLGSWENTLNGSGGTGRRSPDTVFHPELGYSTQAARPDTIWVSHLRSLLPRKEVSLENCRTPVTAVKKWLQANSPLGDYLGSIVLEPGKFVRLEEIETAPAKLTLEQFLSGIARTEPPAAVVHNNLQRNLEQRLRLVHAALGLASEVGEVNAATTPTELREELGDLFWFAALGYLALGCEFKPLSFYQGMAPEGGKHLPVYVMEFADRVKALVFGNKEAFKLPVFSSEGKEAVTVVLAYPDVLRNLLDRIVQQLIILCHEEGFVVEEVLASNEAKLRVRYPRAFTEEAFANRDKAREIAAVAA